MSADNGVYILPITCDGKAWRVTYAMAIENLEFEPDRKDGYNSEQLESYFGDAPEFDTEENAILHAHTVAKGYTILEYGVSILKETGYKFKGSSQ